MRNLEGFSGEAMGVMQLAEDEARSLGQKTVLLKNVLVGLSIQWGNACKALEALGLTKDGILFTIYGLKTGGIIEPSLDQELPRDDEVNAAILSAEEKAGEWGDNHIGTTHLLLGVLAQKNPIVTKLNEMGATLGKVEATILALRAQAKQPANPPLTLEELTTRLLALEERVRKHDAALLLFQKLK